MIFAVHEERGITGAFRLRLPGPRLEVQVVINVTHPAGDVDAYRTWRPATESDLVLAETISGNERRACRE